MKITIESILEEAKKLIDEPEPKFWELINKLEKVEIKTELLGEIEDNVVIKGDLYLGKNSVIKSGTRIEGNVYIGENCTIGPNAYFRGNVIIANNCKISYSEIKNSIILSHTNVPHFSYVGDSILGEDVNLGAGTKIANLRLDEKNIQVEICGKKFDSNRRKLGALIKSGTKTGINVSINCVVVIGKNCFIYPGAFVKESIADNTIFTR